jgi:hypothetical protein
MVTGHGRRPGNHPGRVARHRVLPEFRAESSRAGQRGKEPLDQAAGSSSPAVVSRLRSADAGNSAMTGVSRLRSAGAGSSSPAVASRLRSADAGNSAMTGVSRPRLAGAGNSSPVGVSRFRSAGAGSSSPADGSHLRLVDVGSSSPVGVSRLHSADAGNSPADRLGSRLLPALRAAAAARERAAGARGPHYVEGAARGAYPARPGPRMSAPSTLLRKQVTVPHCAIPVSSHRFLTCSIRFSFTGAQREHEPA